MIDLFVITVVTRKNQKGSLVSIVKVLIYYIKVGTQRVEHLIQNTFTNAKIARLDMDTSQTSKGFHPR